MDAQRQAMRDNMMSLVPPTKDEIARTIFVGGITEGSGGDVGMERILQCMGNLKRWLRATDADNKACRFGFAEYEDPDSLSTAIDVLKDVEVPVKPQKASDGVKKEEDEEEKVEKSKLIVSRGSSFSIDSMLIQNFQIVVDDTSLSYLEGFRASRGDQDPITAQLRLDNARTSLAQVLQDLAHPSAPVQVTDMSSVDRDGDVSMQDGEVDPNGEIVTIPLTVDDELSDIPAEMRETVAKEIAAFRDRSTRRDMERLRREEEMEALERRRAAGARANRLASPPPTSNGPGGGANNIPLGPRDRGVPNAPSGPKGYSESQIPKDYQKGVTFVNGTGVNGASLTNREDDETDASDEEIERRKAEKKEMEQEKLYQDQKRRWLNRERSRTAALERETGRDSVAQADIEKQKAIVAKRLKEWDDDAEASRKIEQYYQDRSLWIRNRADFRIREARLDDLDRASEEREKAKERQQKVAEEGMADDFLNRQAVELDQKSAREPQRFKLSFGAAAQKAQAAANTKRTVAEVEGLLEDEEAEDTTAKRTLIPIQFDASTSQGLSDEQREQATRQLAAEIPNDKEGLWKWDVKWEFVDETIIAEQLKPFVEKKIMEYLGVQEEMLVDVVEEHIRKRGSPGDLVEELEGPMEQEAESMVRKLWRMVSSILFSQDTDRESLTSFVRRLSFSPSLRNEACRHHESIDFTGMPLISRIRRIRYDRKVIYFGELPHCVITLPCQQRNIEPYYGSIDQHRN